MQDSLIRRPPKNNRSKQLVNAQKNILGFQTKIFDYSSKSRAAPSLSLIFRNLSPNSTVGCLYQTNDHWPDARSIAWFAESANSQTQLLYKWTVGSDFVWSKTGRLTTGTKFFPGQSTSASTNSNNRITLTKNSAGYEFEDQTHGPEQGQLYIDSASTVPPNEASIGIGTPNYHPTLGVQAQPNLSQTISAPSKIIYWITFGAFKVFDVLETSTFASSSAEVTFPESVSTMLAILQPNNTWIIEPTEI